LRSWTARATAIDVRAFLEPRRLLRNAFEGRVQLRMTGLPRTFQEVASRFLDAAVDDVEQVGQ
jgi:hypothetical protein